MSVRAEPASDSGYSAPLTQPLQQILQVWGDRRSTAKSDRKRYEPTWQMCKSFLAGRQWVGIHPRTGRVIMDKEFVNRERHTINVIGQYVQTVMGKLFVEDLRPDIVFSREDLESESVATHTQQISKYLWDSELDADKRIEGMLRKQLTYGTGALRCYYDPSQGDELGEFPVGPDGKPITDIEEAVAFVAQAQETGQQFALKKVREGRVCWEDLSPFNTLIPPGVEQDDHFPWLIIDRAMSVGAAQLRFPEVAAQIRSHDIESVDSIDGRDMAEEATSGTAGGVKGLKEHLIVSTGYEMPTPQYPNGRVVIWNDHHKLLLEIREHLPYKLRGQPHHGVLFFHYHQVPGRFWGVGVVEPLIGPQRQKNRSRSQYIEMNDRNLGRVYARKGTITAANKPVGKIMELIEIPMHADFPQETSGVSPGAWIENVGRMMDEDMDRISGLREVSLGQAPAGVSAYSAMALLAEQDERRVGPVLKALRRGIGDAVMLSLEMVREYWQSGRHLAVAGPEGQVEIFNYQRAQLPHEFYIDISKNAPLPTSPAVEAQKIFDLFHAATAAGQPLPVDWLKDSLDAGKALPIPKREGEVQMGKAEQENLMMMQGMLIQPAYYDDDFVHIEMHRQVQAELAGIPGTEQIAMLVEQHIQMHAQNAAMKKPTQANGNQVPQQQGPRGVEGQTGMHPNMQGAAQTAQQER